MDKSKKIKYVGLAIKVSIVVFSFVYIYSKVIGEMEKDEFQNLSPLDTIADSWILFSLAIFMVFLNWGLEAIKWQFLMSRLEKMSFLKSYKAVLSGVTVSIFMPFKMGEYVGRVLHLDSGNRIKGTVLTVYGSMAQLFVTILFGSLALVYFLPLMYDMSASMHLMWYYVYIVLVVILNLFLLMALLSPSFLVSVINKTPLPRKWKKYFRVLSFYKPSDLFREVLIISVLRYLVFSFQFYFCLEIFNVHLPLFDGLVIISITFLFLTFLSISALLELGFTRSLICLNLVHVFYTSSSIKSVATDADIWMASTVLWLINLAVPAMLGALFLYGVKIFKSEK
ncbi:MAG: lysylphosphatidylglycerol synthase domain-containing protein [Flavobacteriales bacterium]